MKETYYTSANLAAQAQDFLDEVHGARRLGPDSQVDARQSIPFIPERAALLVLDMQRYFLDPASHACVPSAAAVIPGLRRLVDAFRAVGQPVIFTRHGNTPENAGRMADWWRELLRPDHPLSAVVAELASEPACELVKAQYDAFLGTDLEQRLRSRGITQVVVGGVMTHLCCESTARGAFMRGFGVYFLVDGTAAYRAAHQRASLLNLAHGFATLCLVPEIFSAVEAAHG